VALSAPETAIVQRLRRAKLFVFLRQERHMLFSAAFQEELAAEVGAAVVGGPQSLKAALDLNWDDPAARTQGVVALVGAVDALEHRLQTQPAAAADPVVQASCAAATQVRD
jgi:hypothetical protein